VQSLTHEAVALPGLLQPGCERRRAAVALRNTTRNAPEALKPCQEIDAAESRADHVMRAAIARRCREAADTRQRIKPKGIFELLESATDKCQDVADVMERLILENA
jgi:uncharacterized protein Yka (UPF0111/DUF47 family)